MKKCQVELYQETSTFSKSYKCKFSTRILAINYTFILMYLLSIGFTLVGIERPVIGATAMTIANSIEKPKVEEIEKQQEYSNDKFQDIKKRQVELEQEISNFAKKYERRFSRTLAINYTFILTYLLLSIGVTLAGIEKPSSNIEKSANNAKTWSFNFFGISLITLLGAALTFLYSIQTSLNIGAKINFYKILSAESNNLLIELKTKPSTEENLEKTLKSFQDLQTREAKERPTDTIPVK